jgi:hypothetical protein
MKPIIYQFPQHGVQVAIAHEARKFVRDNYVNAYTAAEEAAMKHKAKQAQFHAGIVVSGLPAWQTTGDIKAAEDRKRKADGQKGSEVAHNENAPAIAPVTPPAPVCAPASAEASYPEVQVGEGSCSGLPYVGVDGRVWFKNESNVWEQIKGNRTVFEFCGSPRITGPERLAIIASLIASVPAAAKLLGAGGEYEPVEVQPRKGDRMRNVETGEMCIARTDAYVPSGCFRALWKTRLEGRKCHAETYGDGSNEGWRILRRSAPDAGKAVGRE